MLTSVYLFHTDRAINAARLQAKEQILPLRRPCSNTYNPIVEIELNFAVLVIEKEFYTQGFCFNLDGSSTLGRLGPARLAEQEFYTQKISKSSTLKRVLKSSTLRRFSTRLGLLDGSSTLRRDSKSSTLGRLDSARLARREFYTRSSSRLGSACWTGVLHSEGTRRVLHSVVSTRLGLLDGSSTLRRDSKSSTISRLDSARLDGSSTLRRVLKKSSTLIRVSESSTLGRLDSAQLAGGSSTLRRVLKKSSTLRGVSESSTLGRLDSARLAGQEFCTQSSRLGLLGMSSALGLLDRSSALNRLDWVCWA
ncbi:hypothetical protein C7974DRAFT_235238 [Boeremia exigua]|uniref:uncharacterized protein n=1 Tax=Boeremia exigua TaxID=749465 RepID=UPI001E8D07A9|nr:uncharacterized protein C7974DRAFT_235238 [Boeremia exigua]KAH6620491.1 hypothetical protein C7974DRAFT_235238 [Boeremia exigua]